MGGELARAWGCGHKGGRQERGGDGQEAIRTEWPAINRFTSTASDQPIQIKRLNHSPALKRLRLMLNRQ